MGNYKDHRLTLGSSDIASLVLVGPRKYDEEEIGVQASMLEFGSDGDYRAWYVTDEALEIPSHYEKVAETFCWLKIYDDRELVGKIEADRIEVYRAGEMGCLVRAIGEKECQDCKIF